MLKFTYEGNDYELGFTKRTVQVLDKQGFTVDKLMEYPATYIPMLFEASFIAKHKFVNKDLVEKIYESLPDKKGVVAALAELYAEPVNNLFVEPAEGNAIAWTKD